LGIAVELLSNDSPVLLAFPLRKHHLIAIGVGDYGHADLLAPHDGFGFNAGFLELIDPVIEVGLDERH
jgi:hypothetical protein